MFHLGHCLPADLLILPSVLENAVTGPEVNSFPDLGEITLITGPEIIHRAERAVHHWLPLAARGAERRSLNTSETDQQDRTTYQS
jgi:hypothetical protein